MTLLSWLCPSESASSHCARRQVDATCFCLQASSTQVVSSFCLCPRPCSSCSSWQQRHLYLWHLWTQCLSATRRQCDQLHKLPKHGDTLQSVVISNGIGSVVSVAFGGSVASKIQAERCSRSLPKSSSFRVRRHPGRCPDPTPCQPRSSRVSDQQASLVGRVVDDLINQCRVRLHRKMSRFDSDPPAPLVQSLPTASQTSEAPVTSETPELSVSECVSRGDTSIPKAALPSCVKLLSCHHVRTLALAVSELQRL